MKISRRIQKLVADVERDPTPKNFPDRMIFMNMLNDIDLNGAAEEQMCICNSQQDAAFFMNLMSDHWCFIGLGSEQPWNYDTIEGTREK